MRYSDETLARYTAKALDAIQTASNRLDQLKVHIDRKNPQRVLDVKGMLWKLPHV